MKQKMMVTMAVVMCYACLFVASAEAQTFCSRENGTHDGYLYELWTASNNGETCMTLKTGGTFSCEWSDVDNVLFRKGLSFDKTPYKEVGNIIVNFSADFQPVGNGYLAVHGWFADPYVEYYIVESWGSWRPVGDPDSMSTIAIDDGMYDIYMTRHYVTAQNPYVTRYWSVRRTKRTRGTVSVSKHFEKWASLDLTLGSLYDVTFLVEGYQSSGWADVTSMTIGVDEDDDNYKEIAAPFNQDGPGTFKWKMASIPHYINSWNLDSLIINDVDLTNVWVLADTLPEKLDGYYYIDYQALFPWSHVEIK